MRVGTILFLATLTLQVSIHTLAMQRPVPGHKVMNSEGGNYIGGNKISGTTPDGYEGFLVLWVDDICICRRDIDCDNTRRNLTPDANGRIAVCGRVVFKGSRYPQGDSDSDGKYLSYEFTEAHLIDIKGRPIQLIFRTKQRDGISYRFSGKYLKKTQADAESNRIHLKGIMTKLRNGKQVPKIELAFTPYNIIE